MRFLFTLLGLLLITYSFSQNTRTIETTVLDGETKERLIGATIQAGENVYVTNENGEVSIEVPITMVKFKVSYLGYETLIVKHDLTTASITDLTFNLEKGTSILSQVVISGSQNEKIIVDEPTTIEVIKPDFISKNNITSLSEIVERVPGVQMVDDQVNIRSSGYSYGAGSRVGVIVDGQPLLGGLASDIKWNFIPFENAKRVEVLKGASSVLYGSAAMNGVINVVTAWPSSEPETSVTFYGGEYESPKSQYRQWWTEENKPFTRGVLLSHRARTDKFDLVLGGNSHKRVSHLEGLEETRMRFNWKTRYRLTDKITFGINGNVMEHRAPVFLMWMDADTNALKHISFYEPQHFITYSIDPHLTIFDEWDNQHIIRGRYFNAEFQRSSAGLPPAPGYLINGEYQFKRKLKEGMRLTAGTSYQYYYGEDPSMILDTTVELFTASAEIYALYGQLDADFLDDKLNVILGLRGEYITAGDSAFNRLIPVTRLSAVYKSSANDRWRINTGQGYRVPSLVERFANTSLFTTGVAFFPTIDLLPNPNLLPEVGWSIEVGYKRLFNNEYIKGYVDAAFFNMDYWNLAELTFGYFGTPNEPFRADLVGFRTVNISRGRIAGMELSTFVSGKVAKIPYRIWGGYTYTYPGNLDSLQSKNMSYYANLFSAFGTVDEELAETILKYRSLHTARFDFEIPTKWVSLGFAAIFNGYMWQVDDVFLGEGTYGEIIQTLNNGPLIPGYSEFREESLGGNWIYDARITVDLGKHVRLGFIVNNIYNTEYAVRPGRMNATRTYNLKCQLNF